MISQYAHSIITYSGANNVVGLSSSALKSKFNRLREILVVLTGESSSISADGSSSHNIRVLLPTDVLAIEALRLDFK